MPAASILVVDDNRLTRTMLRDVLEAEGYAVRTAADGRGAREAMAQERPDLVLLDLVLPDASGFELADRLRALPGCADVPIVAVTGFIALSESAGGSPASFDEVITKPIDAVRLVAVVRTLLVRDARPDADAGRGRRVLLADDDPVQLKLATILLRRTGFEVVTATNGREALELVRSARPDAVLSDVLMPQLDGFKLCQAIRASPELAAIPVVLVSASYVDESDRELAARVGASALVPRSPALREAIRALLEGLQAGAPPAPTSPAHEVESRHAERVLDQLDRQTSLVVRLAQRCSMQGAMLSVVSTLSDAWMEGVDLEAALAVALQAVLDVAGISQGAVYLRRGHGVELVCAVGFADPDRERLRDLAARGPVLRFVVAERYAPSPGRRSDDVLRADELPSAIAVPLPSGRERLGALVLGGDERRLADEDFRAFARAVGVQLGHAIALSETLSKLSFSEQRHRALVENARDAIFVLSPEGVIVEANRGAEQLLGARRRDFVGRPFTEFLDPEQARKELERFARGLSDTGALLADDVPLRRADGKRVVADFSVQLVQVGGERVALSIAHDVTARKQVEDEGRLLQTVALAAGSAEDLRGALEVVLREVCSATRWPLGDAWVPRSDSVLECLASWTRDDAEREAFRRFTDGWLFPPGEGLPGRAARSGRAEWVRWSNVDAALKRSAVAAELGLGAGLAVPILAGAEVVAVIEFFTREPQEEDEHLVGVVSAVASQLGAVVHRKRAEEALRASEEQVRLLLDCVGEGIYAIDLAGTCTLVNAACVRMLGYRDAADILGRNMHEVMHHTRPDGSPYPEPECRIYVAGLQEEGTHVEDEVFWRADGTSFPVEYRSLPMRRGGARVGAAVSFADVTERRRSEEALRNSEEQLRQAARMEAIGQLAGGIAHDFNNILAVILTDCALIRDQLGDRHPVAGDVDEIDQCARRAAALTRQVLAFSRRQVLRPKVLSLNAVVGDMEKLLRRIIGEDIELATSLEPELGSVLADASELEQVVLNLAVNARDAMPSGGRISIETTNAAPEPGTAPHPGLVRLTVADTGHGIDPAIQARIFEPFFTTKQQGKGTGLGLSTVYGIVQQSGGTIRVTSESGKGATFVIDLPRVDANPEEPSARAAPATTEGTETILVVDDDALVRSVMRKALESKGYTVLQAASGPEALEACTAHGDRIRLVVSDLVIPGMSGVDLARILARRHPRAPVLLVSGYAEHATMAEAIAEHGARFLQKPFTPDVLARKVREVLDG